MKKILFTGGGSAGHVTVNLALIPRLAEQGWAIEYMGSKTGIEKQLVAAHGDVRYHEISSGKLRRYFDWQNVRDPFKIAAGTLQAYRIIKRQRPNVLFSKGGFVSVPVVIAAWLNKVPVLIHESGVTPGLANRLCIPFARTVCTTFPETARSLPGKARYVGPVIRESLRHGDADRGRAFCRLALGKPVLLVMGGSLGARRINETVRESLGTLLAHFQIVHLCGKDQLDPALESPGYRQYEYVSDELPDVLAMSDLVVSRAGANAIFEFLALRKPMLLIPLPAGQSRGDQILNANAFREAGYCEVLAEERLTPASLVEQATRLYARRRAYQASMETFTWSDALAAVADLIRQAAR
ncbi:undecaprenyldiphospho-muramoylpentapeptide beta-N-acetylglucosaminyltransferase [Cohnella sp. REN36]|uniref:undecaprenyldiphospho-muramoylpentapeptide beta-N-acetylglucosaminyltransferase n=1 Tax=Cohnella sp. REN36 TaxID=2887347 RepID=UPI001D139086|nr:undecaprenyldiphospho-muramoylpentapeptide beta-N-acetylglucosaminyltransferase [Cohnella sp. REN36]MCC3372704.1 undecaprenyldiphospho-muramoylpentapeptide beta-N-acetylglucosaminyltransferase [Cohnella sp. REN36]